jgi:hypothetical protein
VLEVDLCDVGERFAKRERGGVTLHRVHRGEVCERPPDSARGSLRGWGPTSQDKARPAASTQPRVSMCNAAKASHTPHDPGFADGGMEGCAGNRADRALWRSKSN